jgi:fumarylacetoacetate (FAA) hydrolase
VSLRSLIPDEIAKGFGFFQSKPASAFSPVAVTPDELGDAWKDSLIHLPLMVDYNGEAPGRAEVGVDATFNMAQLVAHAAKTPFMKPGDTVRVEMRDAQNHSIFGAIEQTEVQV